MHVIKGNAVHKTQTVPYVHVPLRPFGNRTSLGRLFLLSTYIAQAMCKPTPDTSIPAVRPSAYPGSLTYMTSSPIPEWVRQEATREDTYKHSKGEPEDDIIPRFPIAHTFNVAQARPSILVEGADNLQGSLHIITQLPPPLYLVLYTRGSMQHLITQCSLLIGDVGQRLLGY